MTIANFCVVCTCFLSIIGTFTVMRWADRRIDTIEANILAGRKWWRSK